MSVVQLWINLLGYFASPIVSATVMDSFESEVEGMKWGFRLNMFVTILALFVVILGLIIDESEKKKRIADNKPEVNIQKAEFQEQKDPEYNPPSDYEVKFLNILSLLSF